MVGDSLTVYPFMLGGFYKHSLRSARHRLSSRLSALLDNQAKGRFAPLRGLVVQKPKRSLGMTVYTSEPSALFKTLRLCLKLRSVARLREPDSAFRVSGTHAPSWCLSWTKKRRVNGCPRSGRCEIRLESELAAAASQRTVR